MGQTESASGCIVEVAPKSMVHAWSTANPEPDPPMRSWRIVVNPQDELLMQQEASTTCSSRSSSKAEFSGSTDMDHSDCEGSGSGSGSDKRVTTKKGKYEYEKLKNHDAAEDLGLKRVNLMSRPQATVLRDGNRFNSKLQLLAGSQGFSSNEYRSLLNSKIDQLYGCSKVLNAEEAKCLVLAVEQKDQEYLLKTLTTISNLAAFTVNQDQFRRFGLIEILRDLLEERRDLTLSDSTRVMLVQCISNMAVNRNNQTLIKTFIPSLVQRIQTGYSPELEKLVCVQALINLTLDIDMDYIPSLEEVIPFVYHRLWTGGKVNLPMLKFLVNLSCYPQLVPKLLASRSPPGFRLILQNCIGEETLIRSTVFVQYLITNLLNAGIDFMLPAILQIIKYEKYSYTFSETVYFQMFGPQGIAEVYRCLKELATHRNSEIETRVRRILPEFEELMQLINETSSTEKTSSLSSNSSRASPIS